MRNYANQPSDTVDRARTLRRDATDAEKLLWRALREKLPLAKFRRQSPVGPFFTDFLCFASKLIAEVDGGQHDERSGRDAARSRYLKREGYRVIRFWNNDVLQNIDGVLETIAESLSVRQGEGAAKRRKGEGDQPSSSPRHSHPPIADAMGPSLSQGERGVTRLLPLAAIFLLAACAHPPAASAPRLPKP